MLTQLLNQLGVVGIPLVILSVITLALIAERLIHFLMQPNIGKVRVRQMLAGLQDMGVQGLGARKSACDCECDGKCQGEVHAARLCGEKHCLHQGVGVLLSHANCSKEVREEVAALWLMQHRQRMHSGLRAMMLIGTISPMVGLLGTVLGMITMFQGMAAATGPVTPAVLADGLWVSMYTTAYGLVIAIPALGASQAFSIWANNYIGRLEFVLNHVNLHLEGVNSGDGSFSQLKKRIEKSKLPTKPTTTSFGEPLPA